MTVALFTGWLLALATVLAAWTTSGRRRELVARACHELRGPLTAARLGLELGARLGELTPERLEAVEQELASAALALEDLGARRPGFAAARRLEPVSVVHLVQQAADAWEAVAAAHGVELRVGATADAVVRCDRLRLARAIGNLLSNAIEHGGGVVQLGVELGADRVRIEVRDQGPGLAAPLAQLVAGARRGRGAHGRGLAITAAIAAEHGGRLGAPPSGHGARLVLELPAL